MKLITIQNTFLNGMTKIRCQDYAPYCYKNTFFYEDVRAKAPIFNVNVEVDKNIIVT
jgi:hypothetical protein